MNKEDRLIRHCEINGIQIIGIYREDRSAKDFNLNGKSSLIKSGKIPIDRMKIFYL